MNGKTHYLDDSGTARTGWMDTVDDKFYLSTNGEIKTGPLTYKGSPYMPINLRMETK
uniref:hypothetical protein n=1 Tax=Bacillus sp. DX2.2 TaxID=3073452 RepID=UPI00402AA94C